MAPRRDPLDASFDAPSPSQRRANDRAQSAPYRAAYEQGRAEARRSSGARSSSRPARRRRPAPGARAARTAARQLQAPVRAQVASGMRILGMTLALVALYAVLNAAPAFSGVLGGFSRGLDWLRAPDRGIPRKV